MPEFTHREPPSLIGDTLVMLIKLKLMVLNNGIQNTVVRINHRQGSKKNQNRLQSATTENLNGAQESFLLNFKTFYDLDVS